MEDLVSLAAAEFEEKFEKLLKKTPPEVVQGAFQTLLYHLKKKQAVVWHLDDKGREHGSDKGI